MPKGVLWRNGDAERRVLRRLGAPTRSTEWSPRRPAVLKALLAPPFMHGAGHWMSFRTWNAGGTVYVQSVPERLDPVDVWGLIEREQLNFLLIVGDAFARPLLDELDRGDLRPVDADRAAVGRRSPVGEPEGRVPRATCRR